MDLTADQERDIRSQLEKFGVEGEDADAHIDAIKKQPPGPPAPCEPCGEAKDTSQPAPYMENKPPHFLLIGEYLHRRECERIIQIGRGAGWRKGTIIDGTPSRNSSVHFTREAWVLDRMRQLAIHAGPLLGLDVWPDKLESVQLGRYLPPNEDYGWHRDADMTRRHIEYDRKLSLVGALSDGGALEIEGVGRLSLNAGDMLAFSGLIDHKAPAMEYKRYTIVAWVPGPMWR